MKDWKVYLYVLFILIGFLGGCTHEGDVLPEDNTPDSEVGITDENQTAVDLALVLFPGTVQEVELEVEEGQRTWKVDILGTGGAEVEVYMLAASDELYRIDGEKGPFSYDIDPGTSLMTFSEAKIRADTEAGESLESWNLRQDDSYRNNWVYQFNYSEKEVIIHAEDGSVLEVKG